MLNQLAFAGLCAFYVNPGATIYVANESAKYVWFGGKFVYNCGCSYWKMYSMRINWKNPDYADL